MIGDAWDESKRESTEVHVLRSNIDVSTMRPSGESINLRRLTRNFKLLCWRSIAEQVTSHYILSYFNFIFGCFRVLWIEINAIIGSVDVQGQILLSIISDIIMIYLFFFFD